MSDLDKAIREAAYTVDRNKLHAALAVVLDRHVHTGDDDVYIGPKVFWRCRECGGLGGRWCPTVLDIARALDLSPVSSQDTPPPPRPEPRVGDDPGEDGPLLADAIEYVTRRRNGSASAIQRNIRVGFAKAYRLLDVMETWGIVGPAHGSLARQVLMTSEEAAPLIARFRGLPSVSTDTDGPR